MTGVAVRRALCRLLRPSSSLVRTRGPQRVKGVFLTAAQPLRFCANERTWSDRTVMTERAKNGALCPISLVYWRISQGRTLARGSLDSAYFCSERRFVVAVISTTEQFKGVFYACDSLASWRAAQCDRHRCFVWRILVSRILRRPWRVVEIEFSSRGFSCMRVKLDNLRSCSYWPIYQRQGESFRGEGRRPLRIKR